MICASLWSALSVMSAWSVSESYFKTRGSDGIQIEWRVFFSFLGRVLCDGGWWSGLDCVLSHCSSLTDIWKVPLGKNSGLLVADYIRVSCVESPAGRSIKEPQRGGECMSIMKVRYGPCLGNVDDRYGTKTRPSPEICCDVHQCSSNERGGQKRSRLLFFFLSWRLF